MSIKTVREYFKQFGIEDRILEFDVSSATVELAASAVGVERRQNMQDAVVQRWGLRVYTDTDRRRR